MGVDILIIAEGTYPYVRGGVSSWIHQLISNLPDFTFGVFHIGALKSEDMEFKFELPANVHYFEEIFIFNYEKEEIEPNIEAKVDEEEIRQLHRAFLEGRFDQKELQKLLDQIDQKSFLYSYQSWNYIKERYYQKASDIPFLDYFWTVRNMHAPIFAILEALPRLPEVKLFHSPTTGYAGLLGALASLYYQKPFVLTEHGIYTRERKIDLMQADWISFTKPKLLKSPEEFSLIKQIWIDFFIKLGAFAYNRAQKIIALYPGIQKVQQELGAPVDKQTVIPNGVDISQLKPLQKVKREKPVVALLGRVVPIKDIKTFIRAIQLAAKELPDIEGWIVGPTDEDETYYQECLELVENYRLHDHVKFLGFQKITDILPQVKVLTLTSISEGMPLVVLEGFAAGLPVVATDVGSCRTLIEGGMNEEDIELGAAGAVVPIANPSALAKEYVRFLQDDDLWQKAHERAVKRVERFYTKEQFIQAYRDLYNEVINGRDRV